MSSDGKVLRLNPFQFALLRPDTYIGSVVTKNASKFVFVEPSEDGDDGSDAESVASGDSGASGKTKKNKGTIANKTIKYNPGLERLFIEAMSNAIDNVWRSKEKGIPMKRFEVTLDTDPDSDTYGEISITNDGAHISVEKIIDEYEDPYTGVVTKNPIYPAELFFGYMNAGTNFDNDENRKTSGKNGIGVKVVNIFSKKFSIHHYDPDKKLVFLQTFSDNAKVRNTPSVTKGTGKSGWTTVTFLPDYERFGYPGLDDDFVSLIKRHLHDAAMITGLGVTLNGEKIAVKNLEAYARLYYPSKKNKLLSFESEYGDECVVAETDEIFVAEDKSVGSVSFINGIYTSNGGIHVEAFADKIFPFLVEAYNSRKPKKGGVELKTTANKLHPFFTLFVRAEKYGGPNFDSQSKNKLESFGRAPNIITEFKLCEKANASNFNKIFRANVEKMLKWSWVNTLDERLEAEADAKLMRKDKKENSGYISLGSKGSDANDAGKKNAMDCVMYLTEGDSAKSFAERLRCKHPSGNGNDIFGCLALRGKVLNVVNASLRDASANAEIKLIKQVLGLQFGKKYDTVAERKELRYGAVCILTDADDDGIHIEGLLIALFKKYWPGLFVSLPELPHPHFVTSLSTVVVIGKKGPVKNPERMVFYTNPEYKTWHEAQGSTRGWNFKYIKGLGQHSPGDEEIYLNNPKILKFESDLENDNEEHDFALAFDKSSASYRKDWILNSIGSEPKYTPDGVMTLSRFIHEQLIIYHKMVLRRAIPTLMDGMKMSQQKALYGARKYFGKSNNPKKLTVFVGSCTESTHYHHGDVSLAKTIIKLGQGFVGSNNIPLFVNDGQFGSRVSGGDDAAAPRYLETMLEDIVPTIFNSDDDPILEHNYDDGEPVEFKFFAPVVPMILINGATGIASGFSSEIPCYNPDDVVKWIEMWLEDPVKAKEFVMVPWYRGFIGTNELVKNSNGKVTGWISKGILDPPGKGVDVIAPSREKGKGKGRSKIEGLTKDYSKHWTIRESPIGLWRDDLKEWLEYLSEGEIPKGKKWKKHDANYIKSFAELHKSTNQTLFKILPSPEFTPDMTVAKNLKILQNKFSLTNLVVLDEEYRPVVFDSVEQLFDRWCSFRFGLYTKRRTYLISSYTAELAQTRAKIDYISAIVSKPQRLDLNRELAVVQKDLEEKLSLPRINGGYSYLLDMPTGSLTKERVASLEEKYLKISELLKSVKASNEKDMWKSDLANFKIEYAKFLANRNDN
jgi:DNA topoisomerase-2